MLRVALFALSAPLALVACGDDGNSGPTDATVITVQDSAIDAAPDASPDAQLYDFSCVGNAAPTTAPAQLTASGTAQDFNAISMTLQGVAGATVLAFRLDQAPPIATTTTDGQGAWSLAIANAGGMPVDGYIRGTKTGHRTTYLYPPSPIAASFANAPLLLLSEQTFSFITQFAQVTQQQGNGALGLVVVDCQNNPVGNATVAVKQNGQDVGTFFDASLLQPGTSFTFNVPAGPTDITVSYGSATFRARVVESFAGATTTTIVRPGY